jgi:uncharacterized membrane protein
LAVAAAIIIGSVLTILPVLVLTILALAQWIGKPLGVMPGLPSMLAVVAGFALTFFAVGVWATGKIMPRASTPQAGVIPGAGRGPAWIPAVAAATPASLVPALSASLPFLLLVMVVQRMPLPNPSAVFALGALLAVLLLGLARFHAVDVMVAVGLGCVLLLEYSWHGRHFDDLHAVIPLCWHIGFTFLFLAFPFLFAETFRERLLPWLMAALSGPLHFPLIYHTIERAYPNPYLGLVPAIMTVPYLAGLVWLLRRGPDLGGKRNALLALFGGAVLLFVTLIFPIQFERQWITLGWALEGVALLWLFHRIPHEGLKWVGAGLLAAAFSRLALNPEVFGYYARSGRVILNWYLYTYGLTSVCLVAGARLLAPPHERLAGFHIQGGLYALAAVLAFLLLNIEIADYFSAGSRLVFHFSGNLAQDMTYSLAWACYGFGLFMVGIHKELVPPRWAGLGLLTVTMVKLFLHDLWRLGGLYRVGSLIGLAVVLILVSFIYQRFLTTPAAGKDQDAAEM